jgi:hypothetical protein
MIGSLTWVQAANVTRTIGQVSTAVTLSEDVDYHITSSTPFTATGSVNITDTAHAVIIFDALKPSLAVNQLGFVTINGVAAQNGVNCQVKIYDRGAILLPYGNNCKPLTVYSEADCKGDSANNFGLENSGGYMNTMTSAQLVNRVKSFRLKRGYMVTFSLLPSGRGYSRCFIADKADLEVNLPALMSGRVSSYRVFKWNDTSKAGLANNTGSGANDALNTQWCYAFGLGENGGLDRECVPHHIYEDWPSSAACGAVTYSPHLKTNNEPRNTADDHPQDLTTILNNWENLMATGMRLCTPSSWDGSYSFMGQFLDSIDARGWRCDIVDAHCYWTSGSFYSLSGWYNNYGNSYGKRPIWISEWCWGASWNSNGAFASGVTDSDVASALKTICGNLNSWGYIERYAYWNSEKDISKIYRNGALTAAGKYYASMDPGIGYNSKYATYIPSNPRLSSPSDLALTFLPLRSVARITWNESNGELNDSMWVERKEGNLATAQWKYLAPVALGETSGSYTYNDTINHAAYYTYRIAIRTWSGSIRYSNEVSNSVEGSTSLTSDSDSTSVQFGTLTTGTTDYSYLFYAHSFVDQPAVVFGSMSNRAATMAPIEVVSNFYRVSKMNTSFRYHIMPMNQGDYLTEFKLANGTAVSDYVSYIVAKNGTGKVGSLNYEAGLLEDTTSTNGYYVAGDTVSYQFKQTFNDVPVVMATPIMTSVNYPMVARVFDVTKTGFKVVFQRQRSLIESNAIRASAKASFFAIEKGSTKDDNGKNILVADTTWNIKSKTTLSNKINFGTTVENPTFLVQLQTNNDSAMAILRTRPTSLFLTTDTTHSSTYVRLMVDDTDTRSCASPTSVAPWVERAGYILIYDDPVSTGISTVATEANYKREIYSINGMRLGADLDALPAGIYIIREGNTTKKIIKR